MALGKKRHGKKHKVRIGGPMGNPAAYCALHRKPLSGRQMRGRECQAKHCRHLRPWTDRAAAAERRAMQHESRELQEVMYHG